jgi:DNA-binding NarL/FixJ family response regulator
MAQERRKVNAAVSTGAEVLVIDDSDLMRASVLRVLTRAGYSAIGLASPVGATRTILREDVRIVLIDVDMPSISGDKLVGLLRQNRRLVHLKVVLMSGQDDSILDKLANDVGADASIPKSEGAEGIRRVVERLIGQYRHRTPAS